MPEPVTAKPGPDPKQAAGPPAAVVEGPPEEEFWEKYNRRLEFPLASVGTVLLHVAIGALLVFMLLKLSSKEDRSGVPIKLMEIAGIDSGDGSVDPGGEAEPFLRDAGDPTKAMLDSLPDPSKLPEVREKMEKTIKYFDASGKMPISNTNVAAYASLDETVRNKLLGQRKGTEGTGKGAAGTGSDSTLGRNMRWVLRFKVTSGHDYVAQLRALEAKLFFPIPGAGRGHLIEDLNQPDKNRMTTEADLTSFAGLMQFHDSRRDVVNSVLQVLNLERGPTSICAVFPKHVEEELARLEKAFRLRQPEDIAETIFQITIRDGKPAIVVYDQKIRK
jgi:hypothetical protein